MSIGIKEVSLGGRASSSSSATPGCNYGIELTREVSVYEVTGRPQAWRMRITVTDYYNVDPNIFMFLRTGPDANNDFVDTYEAVASPVDIEEYASGAPREGDDPAFYRLAEVDLLSRNRLLLDNAWNMIKADRDELIRTLTYICETTPDEVSRYGTFSDTSDVPQSSDASPDPGEAPESSSCPPDYYSALTVTESDDPDFPVGTVLSEVVAVGILECSRTWEATGVVSGKVLSIETSASTHEFICSFDGAEVDSGGLSEEYGAIISLIKGPGEEYTISVVGTV
jgi:hypothetical protein